MQIIKISPMSFKIILSKEDLSRHGIENIQNNTQPPGDFFSEIIRQTNMLYESSITSDTIQADFFESKDGGGELFLSICKSSRRFTTYLFSTDSIDCLFLLSKRIKTMNFSCESALYCLNNSYSLVIFTSKKEDFLLSCIKEYGPAQEINKIRYWQIKEHQKELFDSLAIEQICHYFG